MKDKSEKKTDRKSKYSKISCLIWAGGKLWRLDRKFLLFVFAAVPVAVVSPLLQSWFSKLLIDRIGEGTEFWRLVVLVLIFVFVITGVNVLNSFLTARQMARRYYPTSVYQNEMQEIESWKTDYENTEKQDFKEISGYAWRDACHGNCALEFFWKDVSNGLTHLLGIVTYASLLVALNPVIFAVVAVTSILTYFTTRWQPAYYEKHKHEWEKQERKRNYLQGLSENFGAAKDIKLYGLEGWIEKMMRDYQAYMMMWNKRCSLRGMIASFLAGLMTLLQNGTAYLVLIGSLVKGAITVGEFVFYFGIAGSIAGFLQGIIGDVAKLNTRADKIVYYRKYYDYPNRFQHGPGKALPVSPVSIEFRDVWYKYDGARDYTLKGITFTLEAGESLALVGINGAGKTTLVKLLCGLYAPTEGEILVGGRKIEEYNIEEYYTLISAVFQKIRTVAFTIFEFVASADLERPTARADAIAAMKAADIWEKVESLSNGMNTHLQKGIYDDGVDLSGGEMQKLVLARAIYKNGAILILDEPTAALDPIAENRLYLKYRDLTKGKTSVYISHRFASTRFCDRIILLRDGIIQESGTHEELMSQQGEYAYMFDMQSQYYQEGESNGRKTQFP